MSVGDNERAGGLGRKLAAEMRALTHGRNGRLACENATRNRARIRAGRSLAALRGMPVGAGDSAIVIAAGPSIKRRDPIRAIAESGYSGALVVTESALAYCLRNGVVPDLVVSLDPHATRIVRWFGDPKLTRAAIARDDYYARQDLDEAFADEMRANREILDLLERHGRGIRIALATSASEAVVDRVLDIGMDVYWWNPMLDDPDDPKGLTAGLQRANGLPALNAGGNVGTACWMMAAEVLGKRHVALTGMDFAYYPETPHRNTQYWREAVALVGEENLESIFIPIHNPHLGVTFYTDPAYYWYRECFLEMAADAECRTTNCTEGGILFGGAVAFAPLEEFLAAETGATGRARTTAGR